MQSEALLPDTEYYSMSDSTTADSAFGHPSMLHAPLYHSSSNDAGEVPRYTAVSKQLALRKYPVLILQLVDDREFQSDQYPAFASP
jgi:hypothetical protein